MATEIRSADPIAAFCAYYHEYNAITRARRQMQTRVLRDFEDHCHGDVLDVTGERLRDYATALVTVRGFHPNTVRQYLNAIKPFLTWLWEQRLIDADTLLELRAIKAPRGASSSGVPNPYDKKDIAKFWAELEVAYPWGRDGTKERAEWYVKRWQNGTSRWNRVQPYAMRLQVEAVTALALFGALRRDEIYNVLLDELHPDNEYIVVRSRKNKQGIVRVRAVPWMSQDMSDAVRNWLAFRDVLAPAHDRPWLSLWYGYRLNPLDYRRHELLMRRIGSGWEYHRMRHTAATVMVRSGNPLERVQKILGHATLQQTLAYAKIDNADVVNSSRAAAGHFSRAFARDSLAA